MGENRIRNADPTTQEGRKLLKDLYTNLENVGNEKAKQVFRAEIIKFLSALSISSVEAKAALLEEAVNWPGMAVLVGTAALQHLRNPDQPNEARFPVSSATAVGVLERALNRAEPELVNVVNNTFFGELERYPLPAEDINRIAIAYQNADRALNP